MRLVAVALAAALIAAPAAAEEPDAACGDSAAILKATGATLRDMRAGDNRGAMLNAVILSHMIGELGGRFEPAGWPTDYTGILDEVAMLAASVAERAGRSDEGDAQGLRGYDEALSAIHAEQCGTTST